MKTTTSTYRDTNFSILGGRLVRDCEIKETSKGTIAKFRIAVKNGEKATTFIDCDWWNPNNVVQYLVKGKEVEVQGRLLTDEWENKDGETRSKNFISVRELSLKGRADHSMNNNKEETNENEEEDFEEGIKNLLDDTPPF